MISCSLVSSRASIPGDIYILGLKSLIPWSRSPISWSRFWSIHGFNTSINSRLFKDISPVLWSNPTLVLRTNHYYLYHIPNHVTPIHVTPLPSNQRRSHQNPIGDSSLLLTMVCRYQLYRLNPKI